MLLLLPTNSSTLPPLLPKRSIFAVAHTRLTRGCSQRQCTHKTQDQQHSITRWRAPVPRRTHKTTGKRDWNPLPAVLGSTAWLALEVCCSQNVNEDDLAFSPRHSLTRRICRLWTTCSYIQIIWNRLVYPSAAAVSGIVVGREGGNCILPAHKFSLRFSHIDEMSKADNFPLLKVHCKKHSGCRLGLSVM